MISARRSVLAVALLGCGTNASPPVTPPQVTTVFEQQWVLFSDPRTDTLLGVGYNLGNQYSTGCYAIGNLRASAGSDTMRLAWNRTSGDTVSVKLADILGFGHQARRAIRGSILLTGLRQLYADDVAPTRIGCRAKGKDGLPLNPAVVALVGATGYSFSLYDERGRSLNGDIDQAGLKGNAVRAQGDTTAVSFGTLRWLGLRLNGYELDGPVGAMVTTGPFSFREPYNIGNNLQVRVEPLGDDRFAVQHGFQGLGSAFGLDTVTAHETFLLGSPGAVPTRGYIYPAAIVPHNQSHYRLNRGEPRRLLVREFARNSDVDSLRNWIAGR